jgi:hypothetical protein
VIGEYTISLWNAGEREKAFVEWQKAVPLLVPAVDQPPSDIGVFLAFLHAAAYFGTMAVLGKPPMGNNEKEDYAAPAPGLFLATDRIPRELYQPIKNNHFLIQAAMFAEGVGHTDAAGKWAKLALDEGSAARGANLLKPFVWLTLAPVLLSDEYIEAVERARSIAAASVPDKDELDEIGIQVESRPRVQSAFSDQRRFEMSLILGLVPLAFRLCTVRFERDISSDIEAVASHLNSIVGPEAALWKEAAMLLTLILSKDPQPWRQLHDQGSEYYRENRAAFGILSLLGSVLVAPELQSLATQIKLAMDLERIFGTKPSIKHKILYPFFEKYWDKAITNGSTSFRTAAVYTRRSFNEARMNPAHAKLKVVFRSIVFCTGLSLPRDLQDWLDQ